MGDRETIDSELRLLAAVRRTVCDEGGAMPTPHRSTSCSMSA
jgi:hypothetical protein